MTSLREARLRHANYYENVLYEADTLFMEGGEATRRGLDLFELSWGNIQLGQLWSERHAAEDEAAAKICSGYGSSGSFLLEIRQSPFENIR